ncbi:MAG: hypothetical protein JXR70_16230 [Spirochaetales bacterium]|nr:hypothetical protein [Spirochaetales bacterium]
MKIKVFVLITAIVFLFSSCDMFELLGRCNPNDEAYDPTEDPNNKPNLKPINPSNLQIVFSVDEENNAPIVTLNWQKNSTYINEMIVERAVKGSSNFNTIKTIDYINKNEKFATCIDDSQTTESLSANEFVYRVKSKNGNGYSDYSNECPFTCPPVVSFSVNRWKGGDPNELIENETRGSSADKFDFYSTSYGIINSIEWDFGDGSEPVTVLRNEDSESLFSNVQHSFPENENPFDIKLKAIGPNGTVEKIEQKYITIGQPIAKFQISADTDSNGDYETELNNENMIIEPGTKIKIKNLSEDADFYIWGLGGEYEPVMDESPQFAEMNKDQKHYIYKINLTAQKSSKANVATYNIRVGSGVMDFYFYYQENSVREITVDIDTEVSFVNNSHGYNAKFSIDYGDSEAPDFQLVESSPNSLSHKYTSTGDFTCTLQMTTDWGETETSSLTVHVVDTRKQVGDDYTLTRNLSSADIDNDGDTDFLFVSNKNGDFHLNVIENQLDNEANGMVVKELKGEGFTFDSTNAIQAKLTKDNAGSYLVVLFDKNPDSTLTPGPTLTPDPNPTSQPNPTPDPDQNPQCIKIYILSKGDSTIHLTDKQTFENLGKNVYFTIGDYNLDGRADIVIYRKFLDKDASDNDVEKNQLLVSKGSGTGGFFPFGAALNENAPAYAVRNMVINKLSNTNIADILLLTEESNNNLYLFTTNNDGNCTVNNITNIQAVDYFDCGDINGDGKQELVIHGSNGLYWGTLSDSSTNLLTLTQISINYSNSNISNFEVSALALCDVDKDNKLELITASSIRLRLHRFNNNNFDTNCSYIVDDTSDYGFNSICPALIDSDSNMDIIVTEGTTGKIYWYPNSLLNK